MSSSPIIDLSKLKTVWIDKDCMGGMPCLRGHRISVVQILASLEEESLVDFAEDYDRSIKEMTDFLDEIIGMFHPKQNPALMAHLQSLRSSTDRVSPSEGEDPGAIPGGGTLRTVPEALQAIADHGYVSAAFSSPKEMQDIIDWMVETARAGLEDKKGPSI